MLVARRTLSIGEFTFAPEERITREAQNTLPAGRMRQLVENGFVEEYVDELALEREVVELREEVASLRSRLTVLEAEVAGKPRRTGG